MDMCGSKLGVDHDASTLKKDEKPTMVCCAADFVEWKDFPKGLKVLLLLHEDDFSAVEIKSKLETMDYLVTLLNDENEALEAVSNKTESFHVAIVEVDTKDSNNSFRFLQMARGLPTIMVSGVHCLSTMMKCIALGAAEFLQKPLSEEKLKNIWQHVVHKAFNAGGNALSKSLEPIKETVTSMLGMESNKGTPEIDNQQKICEDNEESIDQEKEHGIPMAIERFTAPSTPQQEQGGRLPDAGTYREQFYSSADWEDKQPVKDSDNQMFSCSDTKSLDDTLLNSVGHAIPAEEHATVPVEATAEEEVNSVEGTKSEGSCDPKECSMPNIESTKSEIVEKNGSTRRTSCTQNSKANKKKMKGSKVDWTPELHRRFVQAVDQLGIDQAIPSKILDLMKVSGLTRHNIASHLQKYRMNRRHILPKDEGRRWPQHRNPTSRVYIHKPLVTFPPIRSNYSFPPNQAYPVWGHPTCYPTSVQMWGHNGYQTWQPSAGAWPWKSLTKMSADAWGCPALLQEQPFFTQFKHNLPQNHFFNAAEDHNHIPCNLYDVHLGDEVIDEVVKEAISKPWLPLPLGLKPPSTDTILAELHRQGIHRVPPSSSSCG